MLPGAASETVPVPGATRSGFASKSMKVGPDELKPAIVSSLRVSVPFVLEAPTVSTHGALAGAVMPPYCSSPAAFLPKLPAAVDDGDALVGQRLGRERQRVGPVRFVDRARPPTC